MDNGSEKRDGQQDIRDALRSIDTRLEFVRLSVIEIYILIIALAVLSTTAHSCCYSPHNPPSADDVADKVIEKLKLEKQGDAPALEK